MLERDSIRLRTVSLDEYLLHASCWYADPEVLRFSEGGAAAYGPDTLRAMYSTLSRKGELYLVEVEQDGVWSAIGDAALLRDAIPIVIGVREARSRGFGTQVLQMLIDRARQLGWRELNVSGVDPANVRATRMFERAGFRALAHEGDLIPMRTALE